MHTYPVYQLLHLKTTCTNNLPISLGHTVAVRVHQRSLSATSGSVGHTVAVRVHQRSLGATSGSVGHTVAVGVHQRSLGVLRLAYEDGKTCTRAHGVIHGNFRSRGFHDPVSVTQTRRSESARYNYCCLPESGDG